MASRFVHLIILCLFHFGSCILLSEGQAKNFSRIIWYHLPKSGMLFKFTYNLNHRVRINSGGTTMRKIVHSLAKHESYNLTSDYGLRGEECFVVPQSCSKGSKIYIEYGHRQEGKEFYKHKALHVLMLREPFPWLLSRIQHDQRPSSGDAISVNQSIISLLELYSSKYLMYSDTATRSILTAWFDENYKEYISNRELSVGSRKSMLASIRNTQRSLEVIQRLRRNFRGKVLVLITEYFEESIRLLSYIFGSTIFTTLGYKNKKLRKKTALQGQEEQRIGTISELKIVHKLLSPHEAFYQSALNEFFEELKHAKLNRIT